jgi:hypothetical protein
MYRTTRSGRQALPKISRYIFPLPTPFSPFSGIFVLISSTGFLLVKINFIVAHVCPYFKQKMPKNKFFL